MENQILFKLVDFVISQFAYNSPKENFLIYALQTYALIERMHFYTGHILFSN